MRNPGEARLSRWWTATATAICAAALWLSAHPASAAGWHAPSASAQDQATPQQLSASASGAAEGEALFLGRKPLENGGTPCKTCHGISNLSVSHGPTPGFNLTTEYSRFSADALDKYLQQPPAEKKQSGRRWSHDPSRSSGIARCVEMPRHRAPEQLRVFEQLR